MSNTKGQTVITDILLQLKAQTYYEVFEKRNVVIHPEERVTTAYRLWRSDKTWSDGEKSKGKIFGAEARQQGSKQTNNVVKLSFELNTNTENNETRTITTATYFGEVLTYFCHEAGGVKRILAAVKLYEAVHAGEQGSWPYKTTSGRTKFIVTTVNAINDMVWLIESRNRQYLCWTGSESKKHTLGMLRDVF